MILGMTIRILLTALLLSNHTSLLAMTAGYKCVGADGHTKYQAIPCLISDIEVPIDAIINRYPSTGKDFEYNTKIQESKSQKPQKPATQDSSAYRAAEVALQKLARGKYNNSPGSLRRKLLDRSNAICQKMTHCL